MTPEHRELLARLACLLEPRREILEAYLFGSTATGAAQPHSDRDVAVYVADQRPAASPFGYAADLAAALMAALGSPRVDVVVLKEAPPRHAGRPLASLRGDPDVQWIVERGLPLCAQNALDIATTSSGPDARRRLSRRPRTQPDAPSSSSRRTRWASIAARARS